MLRAGIKRIGSPSTNPKIVKTTKNKGNEFSDISGLKNEGTLDLGLLINFKILKHYNN